VLPPAKTMGHIHDFRRKEGCGGKARPILDDLTLFTYRLSIHCLKRSDQFSIKLVLDLSAKNLDNNAAVPHYFFSRSRGNHTLRFRKELSLWLFDKLYFRRATSDIHRTS